MATGSWGHLGAILGVSWGHLGKHYSRDPPQVLGNQNLGPGGYSYQVQTATAIVILCQLLQANMVSKSSPLAKTIKKLNEFTEPDEHPQARTRITYFKHYSPDPLQAKIWTPGELLLPNTSCCNYFGPT